MLAISVCTHPLEFMCFAGAINWGSNGKCTADDFSYEHTVDGGFSTDPGDRHKGPSKAQGPSLLSKSLADLAFLLDQKE